MESLSVEEAARLLHMNVKRVQILAREGKLPGTRVGRRWLFSKDRLEGLVGSPLAGAPLEKGIELSARNQLRGRIAGIHLDGIMGEIRVAIGDQELVSVITRSSVERLHLKVGDEVLAIIKSTEVMIGRKD
ncbi:MAG: TOBE domain-containing protein [Gemmatimonadota bacterium]